MKIGDVIEATVTSIQNYGIWLDARGEPGLVMIPDISNRRVAHPSEYAKVGDVLTVKIIGFNTQKGQFVASRRVLHPEEQSTE
jgi:small subunit ribosomal protein S1